MKKSILYIASLLIAAVGFSACDDDKSMPPLHVPGSDLDIPQTNTTILEFKKAFQAAKGQDDFSYATLVGEKEDSSHYIISGVIVSSDKGGNIYKNIMIQDSTAGLTIAVDQSDLYKSFKVGQVLTIDATGLYMGAYGRCMQLGWAPQSDSKKQPSRISEEVFAEHAFAAGFPATVEPQVVTVEEITEARKDPELFLTMQSRYVKFENMEFETPGEQLASQGQSVSRYALDEQGKKVQLYNSGYSSFWANTLPSGKGNITGILSYYNSEWQILLLDLNGIENFSGSTAPINYILQESFASGQGTFTIENEVMPSAMSYVWNADTRYSCMKASAFVGGSNYASSSYLISPEIDLTDYTEVMATFEQAVNYYSDIEAAKKESTFEIREVGGEWEVLEIPSYPTSLSWTFQNSGKIDLTKYAGKKVQFAFHYSSDKKAGTWEIKNLKVFGFK